MSDFHHGLLECLDRSLRLNPNSVAALVNAAFILGRRDEFSAAAEYCRRAIHIDPKLARAWYVLGLATAGSGDQETAILYLEAAEKLGFAVDWGNLVDENPPSDGPE